VRGLFVTGTGTGVGKTILSAALLAAMRAAGQPALAHKPVVTGLSEPPGTWPADHDLLAAVTGMDADTVAPVRLRSPSSPHLAAALEGREVDPVALIEHARDAGSSDGPVVIEGVGGLLVPLAADFSVCDLAVELGLPVVIAASPGLGTINHTLLTLRVARAAGLDVRAIVLTPWPAQPSELELSNRATIARLGAVQVEQLELLAGPDLGLLARAGERLPWRSWLEG
jgi:dethiobiotin synthetase